MLYGKLEYIQELFTLAFSVSSLSKIGIINTYQVTSYFMPDFK